MLFQIIAGYKFIPLTLIEDIKVNFLDFCHNNHILGTILISHEGINLNLAARPNSISVFKDFLAQDHRFENISFRESFHTRAPFKRLKVKLKKEIITFKKDTIRPWQRRARSVTPKTLKQWLDENQNLLLLDTRNDYEIRFGTFAQAISLNLHSFSDLQNNLPKVNPDLNIVTFCTSGIRCEKAALFLEEFGYTNVFQLEGGILNYFSQVGGDHYQGACFVFDDRIAVNANLETCNLILCKQCQAPMASNDVVCQGCLT